MDLSVVDMIITLNLSISLIILSWFIFYSLGKQDNVFIVCVEVNHFWKISIFQNMVVKYSPLGGVISRNSCELFFKRGKDAVNIARKISYSARAQGISIGVGISFSNIRRQWFSRSQFVPLSMIRLDDMDIAVWMARKAMDDNAIYVDSTAYGLLALQGYHFSDPFDLEISRFCIYQKIYRLMD